MSREELIETMVTAVMEDFDFDKYESSATAYAWFIWEKGFKGNPEIHWFN